MKKENLLRIVTSVAIAMFVVIGVNAQQQDANLTVDEGTDQYVTVSKALPYHVVPDSYFNPNYNGGGGWAVTSTFLWSFTVDPSSFTISDATAINPDITIGEVGDFTLNVVESSADCGGSTTSLTIHVLAAPTCDFGGAADVEQCGDMAATNVVFDITDNSATDFLVDWDYDVDNLEVDKSTLNDELAAQDASNTDDAHAAAGAGLVLTNQAFPVLNGKVTRYTFTLTGINDAVSRASDYIAPGGRVWPVVTFTDYSPGADDTFIVMVLPAPSTGNIYHIPNL